jgi:DNA recombination protein RmuC
MTTLILISAVSIVLILISFYLIYRNKIQLSDKNWSHSLSLQEKEWIAKLSEFEKEMILLSERLKTISEAHEKVNSENILLSNKFAEINVIRARLEAENKMLVDKINYQAKEFERLQKQAVSEFENIANKLLKQNSLDFSELNHKKMDELIIPLKEKISLFEKKVEETYEKGLKDQTDLKAELKKLYELNNRISDEANNLTKALKGDVKKQGNWGEVVLERILERSGLTEGQEFSREVAAQNAEGKNIRPDVVINLPDKKHIIVDSKVSLIAYERYVSSDEPSEKERFVKDHIISIKNHVKELHGRHYSSSPQFNSPDFVLLFMPIESSFSVAIEQDHMLFNYAWDHKIVIVCPSTLFATLRTIASIWQQENQTRNALEIARQSGALYDKFVGFLEDLEKIGKNIYTLQRSYDDADKKLRMGTGNIIGRVEKLKALGASATKKIPEKFNE